MVGKNQKIWGSLLFAKTDWTNIEDIEYYINESKKIDTVLLFDENMLNLNVCTKTWLWNELEKLGYTIDSSLLNSDDIMREYGYVFQEMNRELNEILIPELFEEFNYNDEKKMIKCETVKELEESYLVHENEILINKVNEKFSNINYHFKKFISGTSQMKIELPNKQNIEIPSYHFKFKMVPRIHNITEYIYTDLKDYLMENEFPIRCICCEKIIENPSKYQLARARRKDDVFHKPCYEKNKREKDKIRKQNMRKG